MNNVFDGTPLCRRAELLLQDYYQIILTCNMTDAATAYPSVVPDVTAAFLCSYCLCIFLVIYFIRFASLWLSWILCSRYVLGFGMTYFNYPATDALVFSFFLFFFGQYSISRLYKCSNSISYFKTHTCSCITFCLRFNDIFYSSKKYS